MSPSHHGRLALALSAAALFVAIGGSAIAAIAAIPQDGRFTACYQTSNSVLDRIVLFAEPNESCPSTYARVTWSQAGQAGPAGPQGPQGPPGPQGPAGSSSQGSTGRFSTLVAQKRAHLSNGYEMTVKCPTAALGKAVSLGVVGGGADAPGPSYPSIDAKTGRATGWTFRLRSDTQTKAVTVFAICARVVR